MVFPNAWVLPLMAVGVGFHLAVSWALLWRYFQARERSYVTWAAAWLLLSLHVLGMFLTHNGLGTAPFLRDVSMAGAAILLYVGQTQWEGTAVKTPWQYWTVAGVGAAMALVAGLATDRPVVLAGSWLALISVVAAGRLARPWAPGSVDVTRWLLFAAYAVSGTLAVLYALPFSLRVLIPLEVGGQALFSLLFSAAVTWQAWEHEQAVQLFTRTLESLNKPMSTGEAMQEALNLVADLFQVSQAWIILRDEGRGDANGGWTIGAALGFPGWSTTGLNGPAFPIDTCRCLKPVDPEQLLSTVKDLPCARLSVENRRPDGRHLTIPLGAGGQVQGLMSLLLSPVDSPNRDRAAKRLLRTTDPGTVRLLTAMGEQIGLALDRARLYDELKAKEEARGRLLAQLITAQEDERRRIARELHDETGQALTALVVNLDFLVRHPVDENIRHQRLAAVRDMAESTLAEVRRVIHEMRPSVLDDLGLEAAIRWLIRRFEATDLEVALELKGIGKRLPGPYEITVFRLIQEACTNTVKHAQATHMHIRVNRLPHHLDIEVADDGRGISSAQLGQATGMGLAGLRERVSLLGGSLTVESAPGKGTRILAKLPLEGAIADDNPSADLRRPHDGQAGGPHGATVGARY